MVLSLVDNTANTQPLLTLPDEAPIPHSPDYIDSESAKLHLTLGQDSPGLDVLTSAAQSGNSDRYKQLLAEKKTLGDIKTRNDILSEISQKTPDALTPDMIETVRGLSNSQIESPDLGDIIEKEYARKYTNVATASLDNGILDDAMAADPAKSHAMIDRTEVLGYKFQMAQKALDSLNETIKNQSFLGKGYNLGENMILDRYQTYNAVDSDFVTSVLPGQNRQEGYEYLLGLSNPNEFKTKLDATIKDLASRNPYTAAQWLQGFFSYGNYDAAMENVNAGLDVASVLPVGKLSTALKSVLRGVTKNPSQLYKISALLGKNGEAATGKLVEDLQAGRFLDPSIRGTKELEDSVASLAAPNRMLDGADKLPSASYNRLADALVQRADLAKRFLSDPTRIDRLTPEELLNYKDILLDDYVKQNPSIQKNVIDVRINPSADLGNVYTADVVLGQRDGTLFNSEKQAENYFKRYIGGTNDYQILQNGDGFEIHIPKTVNEDKIFSDIKLGTTQRTPESLANTFNSNRWTQIRSADYVVSKQQVQARATVTSQHELLGEIVDGMAGPFRKLDKKSVSELEDLTVQNREKQEYYQNFSEFNDAFYKRFGKAPTEDQVNAYFAYVQLNDLDLVVRDLDWYKQKARLGLENTTVKLQGADHTFEGKVIDRLPYGSKDPFSVLTIDEKGQPGKIKRSTFMSETDKKNIERLVNDENYKIVQVADQNFVVGEGDNARHIGFIVTKNLKRDRVGVQNVDRRPGGHKVYKYPWYVKQGIISADEDSAIYLGDRTAFNFATEKDARSFLETFEAARKKYLAGDSDALKFVRDNLPISTKRFVALFSKGQLRKDIPLAVTRSGIRTINTGAYQDLKNLRDLTKSEHNLSHQITGSYAGERSTTDMPTVQSEGNLLFEIQPASFLSPLDTLRQATANMISVQSMNDYTLLTRDNFIREFSDVLKGTTEEQKASGLSMLQNPEFKPGVEKINPQKVAAAKNVSRAYNQLMNAPTSLDRQIEFYKEKLTQGIADKLGPRGKEWLDRRQMGRTKSLATFMKSVAFDLKLGLFNIQQYFIQANSAVNIMAIAGKQGLQGILAYPFVRAALMTSSDDLLKGIAGKVQASGIMKADDFLESMKWYKNSGFNIVGGDVGYLDTLRSPELKQSMIGGLRKTVLSAGRTPFQEGERVARISAWNAAYLEKKAAIGGRELTRRDAQEILSRAKDLAGNMFRESNSAWQKGYASVLTQFFGYQARIMEQFLGKKLTTREKARLFTGYSVAYGVPTALGSAVGILPIRDMVQDWMYSNGMDPEDDSIRPYMDGLATEMTHLMLGREYNISDRFGPGGLRTFYDLWRQDKDFSDIFLGASGSILLDTMSDAMPFLKGMLSEFSDFDGSYMSLAPSDFSDILRNISTVDNWTKMYQVWNTGIWASKHGTNLTDMDIPDALVATITGLQPQRIEEAFGKYKATKSFQDYLDGVQKDSVQEYRKIMKMPAGPEREVLTRKLRAKMIASGMTLSQQAQTWKRAADQENLDDTFFQKYEDMKLQKENAQTR